MAGKLLHEIVPDVFADLGAKALLGSIASDDFLSDGAKVLLDLWKLDGTAKTLYVSRPLTNASDLHDWMKTQGFKSALDPADMHVTVAFSRAPVDWSETGDHFDNLQFSAGSRSVATLGKDGEAVVLKFDAPDLAARHEDLKAKGATWDWPSYQPHVTLTYDASGVDLSSVQPYTGVLKFGPEKFAEVDEGWSDGIDETAIAKSAEVWVLIRKFDPAQPRDADGKWMLWHGSPSGDLRGSANGLHVGSKMAATQALNARIGVPAAGEWDGTRKYGDTLLAGRKTLLRLDPNGYNITGANSSPPDEDYLPKGDQTYADGTKVSLDAKPDIFPVRITGEMSNTTYAPIGDTRANATMQAQITRGKAKRGYFYINDGEDTGSISAVVPNGDHVERVERNIVKYDESEDRDDHGRWTNGGGSGEGAAGETGTGQPDKPLYKPLNKICKTMTDRMFKDGYDVSPNAPNTYSALVQDFRKTGRMKVWDGASENTIFANAQANYDFRAWHDACHLRGLHRFNPAGEVGAFKEMVSDVRSELGKTPEADNIVALLHEEIVGQLTYGQNHAGQFPVNQRAFAEAYLKDPDAAVKADFSKGIPTGNGSMTIGGDNAWGRFRDVSPDADLVSMIGRALASLKTVEKYDDDEPRDEDGRWTFGGGSSGAADKPKPGETLKLDSKQKQALSAYKLAGYTSINNYLRKTAGETVSDHYEQYFSKPTNTASHRAIVSQLDSAIEQSTLARDTTVLRGANRWKEDGWKAAVGKDMKFAAYMSTTDNADIARNFETKDGGATDHTLFKISLPKGAHALPMSQAIMDGEADQEGEILLPRGSSFHVDKIDTKTHTVFMTMKGA